LPVKLNRWRTSLAIIFVTSLCIAQSPTAFLTADVRRAGDKLACLCGACKNTVGTCQMLGCHYAAPAREKIAELQKAGMNDDQVAAFFVKREGLKAFAVPPAEGFNAMSWLMPPIAILLGLMGIAWWIKRSRRPVLVNELPDGSMDRVRAELDKEMAKFE
jgi:cytochrome c-type biogenesis protein CcmH/NrfF